MATEIKAKKKNSLWKIPTQKDVKLENPPKPKPGCQSEDRTIRRIQFKGKTLKTATKKAQGSC